MSLALGLWACGQPGLRDRPYGLPRGLRAIEALSIIVRSTATMDPRWLGAGVRQRGAGVRKDRAGVEQAATAGLVMVHGTHRGVLLVEFLDVPWS